MRDVLACAYLGEICVECARHAYAQHIDDLAWRTCGLLAMYMRARSNSIQKWTVSVAYACVNTM